MQCDPRLEAVNEPHLLTLCRLCSDMVIPLMLDLNRSLVDGLNLPRIKRGLVCVDNTLSPAAFPNLTVATVFLTTIQGTVSTGVYAVCLRGACRLSVILTAARPACSCG